MVAPVRKATQPLKGTFTGQLTVGDLKKLIESIPDDVRIAVRDRHGYTAYATSVGFLTNKGADRVTFGVPAVVAPAETGTGTGTGLRAA